MSARARLVGVVAAAASLAVGGLMIGVPGASASVSCVGAISNSTINDSVVIPATASCIIINSTINGSLSGGAGGSVTIVGATIKGNVDIRGAHDIRVGNCAELGCPNRATVVNGTMSISGTTSVPDFPTQNVVCDTSVTGGNLTIQSNQAPFNIGTLGGQCFFGAGDVIGGSLVVSGNTAAIRLQGNQVGGFLYCTANTPPPVNGTGNTAAGGKFGQCAGF